MANILGGLTTMPNWNKIVEDHNKKQYKWPDGWDTKETIAEQLDCTPRQVTEHLASAIRSGEVEKKLISYWDDKAKRKTSAYGYRPVPKSEPKEKKLSVTIKWPPAEGTRISRRDNPKNKGTYIGKGKIQWDNGLITEPKGSTIEKIILAI